MSDAVSSGAERGRRVERLLAAARDTVAEVPHCWVVTPDGKGGANARIVRESPLLDGDDAWTRCFLARPTSRKVAEIRGAGRVTLAYQHGSGGAYVALAGRAELVDDPSVVRARLRPVDDPDGTLAARLIAVRVLVDRVEVHVRGVTAEPWGHGRTLIERDGGGTWRLLPD